jgi:hypothetical protein
MTGIELTEDGCVLVEIRRGLVMPRLSAVVVIEPPFWPPAGLAAIRRRKRFSPHARMVAWNPDGATLDTLVEAGFTIETIISPERALAILAAERERTSPAATVWVALSRRGAAVAFVRRGEVLYSRRIDWQYKAVTRPNQQQLQRYLFVAHLAPEIQRGVHILGRQLGVQVDGVVMCGALPDLGSLVVPLAQELALKVETLDSLEDFDLTPAARADRAEDYAPAVWLATAVTALPPVTTPPRIRWFGRAAATFAVVVGIGLAGASLWPRAETPTPTTAPASTPAPAATSGDPGAPSRIVPLIPQSAQPSVAAGDDAAAGGDAVPTVTSILIVPDRRLAILNGRVVTEGDRVGRRKVSRIERDSVTLTEPSGARIRVGISPWKHEL